MLIPGHQLPVGRTGRCQAEHGEDGSPPPLRGQIRVGMVILEHALLRAMHRQQFQKNNLIMAPADRKLMTTIHTEGTLQLRRRGMRRSLLHGKRSTLKAQGKISLVRKARGQDHAQKKKTNQGAT